MELLRTDPQVTQWTRRPGDTGSELAEPETFECFMLMKILSGVHRNHYTAGDGIYCKLGPESTAHSSRDFHPVNTEPAGVKCCNNQPTGRETVV